MNKHAGYHILRVGMGITFIWIGVLIFRDPEYWGGFLQPWAANLLFLPIEPAMILTAILDIAVGLLFLLDVWVWAAALVGGVHLIIVLAVTGINAVTVRDIGLLGGAFSLFWDDLPRKYLARYQKKPR